MLNSTSLRGRQTRMSNRRAVGANLVPTLVRLAECADPELSPTARAVVLAIYGDKLPNATHNELMGLTNDELETMLDVMQARGVGPATVPDYLTLFLGPRTRVPATSVLHHAPRILMGERMLDEELTGLYALARLRDAEAGTQGGEVAGRVLRLDLLGRLTPAVRAWLAQASALRIRAMCDEIAEHDVPDNALAGLLDFLCV